jgi:dTDP-4-dehydrorhamnose reductase
MDKILLTGGSGLLGTELQKYLKCETPSHDRLDITNPRFSYKKYNLVIHAAAYTNVEKADTEQEIVFNINLGGTINLLYEYGITPFVYISSEYAHNPLNMYSASKYAGEVAVKCLAEKYLIIRTLFKPTPWKHDVAWEDQWTQGDYVDVIAPLIVEKIKHWRRQSESQIVYIGTGRKTMFELAQRTKPDVKPVSIKKFVGVKRPIDYL